MEFTVLLSLYSKESPIFFNECFNSIWEKQSIKPSEIVLVLDGAIGNELQDVVDFWSFRIGTTMKVLALSNNVGLGKALNEGLKICSKQWVFRMDTDDICTPNRFQKQIEFINSNPDVTLFGGQILEFNHDISDASTLKSVPLNHHNILTYAQKRCPFNHMTVAYKKNIILELGGYQHHLFMEDYNLWLRVIGAGYKVANLPDIILYARVGNGMHARRKGLEYIKSEKQLLSLKKCLKIQKPIHANMLFLIRSAARLMPTYLLGKIYNIFLRKNFKK